MKIFDTLWRLVRGGDAAPSDYIEPVPEAVQNYEAAAEAFRIESRGLLIDRLFALPNDIWMTDDEMLWAWMRRGRALLDDAISEAMVAGDERAPEWRRRFVDFGKLRF